METKMTAELRKVFSREEFGRLKGDFSEALMVSLAPISGASLSMYEGRYVYGKSFETGCWFIRENAHDEFIDRLTTEIGQLQFDGRGGVLLDTGFCDYKAIAKEDGITYDFMRSRLERAGEWRI